MSISALRWARNQTAGNLISKAVLMAIAGYADDNGTAWPSVGQLSLETEMSERAVQKAIAGLVSAGLLTREKRIRSDLSQSSNRLTLNITVEGEQRAPRGERYAPPPPVNNVHPGVNDMRGGGEQCAPLVILEPPDEPLSSATADKHGCTPRKARPGSPSAEEPFNRFWQEYPRRDGPNPKKPARAKFEAAVKRGANPEEIIRGVRQMAQRNADKPEADRRFIPHAVTWLSQERWQDVEPAQDVAPAAATVPDEKWRRWVTNWQKTGSWSAAMGPAPNEPDTLVPAHIWPGRNDAEAAA